MNAFASALFRAMLSWEYASAILLLRKYRSFSSIKPVVPDFMSRKVFIPVRNETAIDVSSFIEAAAFEDLMLYL